MTPLEYLKFAPPWICKKCGLKNFWDNKVCAYCKHKLGVISERDY